MMTNQTPLNNLRQRIERASLEMMPALLLQNELKRHTRRGDRGCRCEYCAVKCGPIYTPKFTPRMSELKPTWLHYKLTFNNACSVDVEEQIHTYRLRVINSMRKRLNEIILNTNPLVPSRFKPLRSLVSRQLYQETRQAYFNPATMKTELFAKRNVPS